MSDFWFGVVIVILMFSVPVIAALVITYFPYSAFDGGGSKKHDREWYRKHDYRWDEWPDELEEDD